MATDTAPGIELTGTTEDVQNIDQSTVMSLIEAVHDLQGRVADLEERAETAEDERDTIKEDFANYREAVGKRLGSISDTDDHLDEVEQQATENSRGLEYVHDRIDRVTEAGFEDVSPTFEGGKPETTDLYSEKSPLEQITNYSETDADEHLHVNEQRARVIAMDVEDYATGTPKGLIVSSADIRKVMAARDEDNHDETISRIMDYLEDFGKGEVTTKMHKGRRIAVFDKEAAKRYGTGPRPDSQSDVIRARARS